MCKTAKGSKYGIYVKEINYLQENPEISTATAEEHIKYLQIKKSSLWCLEIMSSTS